MVAGGGNTNRFVKPLLGFATCCLTRRSSGPTAACHQAPATGTLYIFCGRGLASCRCGPLTSNVRLHNHHVRLRRLQSEDYFLHPKVAFLAIGPSELFELRVVKRDRNC